MKILYGREYYRKRQNPIAAGLHPEDVHRCITAVENFLTNPNQSGLNFERLGSTDKQNHWSIRASRSLRVILAVDPGGLHQQRIGLMNMGQHDDMYEWALQRKYHSDLDTYGDVWNPPNGGGSAIPPSDFEEWAIYLPEEQRRLVKRQYHSGMGRIRGAAGTGKSVVALHRAMILGRRYPDEKILVTTYVKSLCNHMQERFSRMPDPPQNVEFLNVDALSRKLVNKCVNLWAVNAAFKVAYEATIPQHDWERLNQKYLREEVCRVIKGRDAKQDEYLDTDKFERLGRVRSFRLDDRKKCWHLREVWDDEMRKRGTEDFADLMIKARDLAHKSAPEYRAAIIDESQDMTLVQMQFVRALVGWRSENDLSCDAILVLDDSAQRIYPGGFRPKWAGLNFRGTSEILKQNFRNNKRIFDAARSIRGEIIIGKEDNDDGACDEVLFDRGEGVRPRLIITKKKEVTEILDNINSLLKDGYTLEEIGVLTYRNKEVRQIHKSLNDKRIRCVNLQDLKKTNLGPGVRVGTFDRAKGMEFRVVFIPRLGGSRFPLNPEEQKRLQPEFELSGLNPEPSDEEKELRQLNLDRLFVAMTRARDRLFLIADEQPCVEIERARDQGKLEDHDT